MDSAIAEELKRYEPELIAIRHDIHRHPEVGFEEVRTAKLVADRLRGWGVDVAEGIARTGVVGTLRGRRPGQRAIGLRADLDALHIRETSGRDYASQVPGKMHACGHDGHTTMLLGAARYLAEHPDFGGAVHFIFQPAEEGLGGGRAMVEEATTSGATRLSSLTPSRRRSRWRRRARWSERPMSSPTRRRRRGRRISPSCWRRGRAAS